MVLREEGNTMKIGLRIWILIIVLSLALLAIQPWKAFDTGVLIKSVELNSSAFDAGLRQGQIISAIDGKPVITINDYSSFLSAKNYSNINNSTKHIPI